MLMGVKPRGMMSGKLFVIGCSVLLGLTAPALAADFSDPLPRYERAGNGFGCHTDEADFQKGEKEKRDVCLLVGPLFVGMARSDAEALLGNPVDSVPVGTRQAFAYSLQKDSTGLMVTYAVLTYRDDGRADSVQLTGLPSRDGWQFCGLTLGSSEAAATARLGPPLQTEKSDQPGTTQWNYSPWTFSFEITAGAVSSIRLAE
jgi:hypothetical protein